VCVCVCVSVCVCVRACAHMCLCACTRVYPTAASWTWALIMVERVCWRFPGTASSLPAAGMGCFAAGRMCGSCFCTPRRRIKCKHLRLHRISLHSTAAENPGNGALVCCERVCMCSSSSSSRTKHAPAPIEAIVFSPTACAAASSSCFGVRLSMASRTQSKGARVGWLPVSPWPCTAATGAPSISRGVTVSGVTNTWERWTSEVGCRRYVSQTFPAVTLKRPAVRHAWAQLYRSGHRTDWSWVTLWQVGSAAAAESDNLSWLELTVHPLAIRFELH